MTKTALLLGALAVGSLYSLYACMETGPDAPPRKNGCIYLECEDGQAPPPTEGGPDAGGADAPVGLRDSLDLDLPASSGALA